MIEDLILYFFVAILTATTFHYSCKYKKNKNKNFTVLYLIPLAIITLYNGLRYNVGTDFKSYVNLYDSIVARNLLQILNSNIELGHYVICQMSELLFGTAQGMIILYSFFTNYFLIKAIEKINSKYYGISYLVFILHTIPFTLNGMRQGLALAILFFALNYSLEKKTTKFVIFCLIASLFHTSALVFLPFGLIYSVMDKEYKNKYNILLAVILIALILSGTLLQVSFLSKYSGYLLGESTAGYLKILTRVPVHLSLILIYRKNDGKFRFIYTLIFIGFLFMLTGYKANYLDRLAIYFENLVLFTVPYLIDYFKERKNKLMISVVVMCFYFTLFIVNYYINGYHDIFPYNFI